MIQDIFVINPTVHAYNLSDDNLQPNRFAPAFRDTLWHLHSNWNPPHLRMSQEAYFTSWSTDTLVKTLFLESDVDIACHQNLRLDSWFKDGLASHEKNVDLATRFPNRVLTYVGVDPMDDTDSAIADMEAQMKELPNSVGLKLYPDRVNPLQSWRMDDPEVAFPIFAAARDLGIKTVAVHKAVCNGPVPINAYKVDDVFGAAIEFPELNFEIVHAGMAFVEETCQAIAQLPNVYANLEITTLLLHLAPGMFEEVLAKFFLWAGPAKIVYSDGSIFCHSQGILEHFMAFDFSDEYKARYGLPTLTHEMKAMILGENYARLAGLDIPTLKAGIENDAFEVAKRENGLAEPYSHWRAEAALKQGVAA
ncbi:amidohydrolase family protein [Sphingobium algorifonticola]|uniref:Amidohydrolase n=1 Tax=Sphingobium algorifonticola TaxID=2008318 RepID=A0A437JBC0_9SPHN|nr:amidohydrolase family protein [Sphingobium algorifonticola]RVT43216.1 amidohydrolase [Sphingobium algorifonticola]